MLLNDLLPGNKGIVKKIVGNPKLVKRLSALGCIEGTEIKIIRTAPLGDPIIINFKGFNLAIRKKDAKNIYILT